MPPDGLTLYVNDWDDDGTVFDLVGRGRPLSTYCVLTLRAAILARLTRVEREELQELPFVAPEHFVRRVILDSWEAQPDCDWLEEEAA